MRELTGSARVILLLFIAATIPAVASAAGKVTVDPNLQGAVRSTDSELKPDTRLTQKITYEAFHKPVKTILADLTQMTGVTLNAGFNRQDWQVRDRKMNIIVKDLPLKDLIESIARVMNFKWERGEHNPPLYRLVQDRRLLAKLQAEATKREDELKQEVKKRRTALIDALAEVSTASDADLAKLKTDNPYLYSCAESGLAKLVTQLLKDAPDLREAMTTGNRNVSAPLSILPESTRQLYLDVLRKSYGYNKTWRGSKPLPQSLEKEMETALFQLELVPRPRESRLRQQLYEFGGMGTPLSNGHYVLGMFRDPNAESAQILARTVQTVVDGDTGREKISDAVWASVSTAQAKGDAETDYYLMLDEVTDPTPILTLPRRPQSRYCRKHCRPCRRTSKLSAVLLVLGCCIS
jgi:hypothetical protein